MQSEDIKFSVITICRNEEINIKKTILSVINQHCNKFEYLIIDGDSTDNTVEIINGFRKEIEELNIPFIFISEPDKGLYDAMNKAVRLAKGTWTIFINAGDEFYSEDVLERIEEYSNEDVSVLYGDVLFYDNGHYKYMNSHDIKDLDYMNPIFHQGSFTRTADLKEFGFNPDYRIVADYDLFLRLYIAGKSFMQVNQLIAVFDMNGISTNNPKKCHVEMAKSRKENGFISRHNKEYLIFKYSAIHMLRCIAKKIMGESFYTSKRGWYENKIDASK